MISHPCADGFIVLMLLWATLPFTGVWAIYLLTHAWMLFTFFLCMWNPNYKLYFQFLVLRNTTLVVGSSLSALTISIRTTISISTGLARGLARQPNRTIAIYSYVLIQFAPNIMWPHSFGLIHSVWLWRSLGGGGALWKGNWRLLIRWAV